MKYCLGILIFLQVLMPEVFSQLRAQPTNWLWAKSGGGKGNDQASSIAVDTAGNIFATGSFQDSAFFSGSDIRATSGGHLFLAKYSSGGSFLWIKTTGMKGQSNAKGIAISDGKHIYLTGYFTDSVSFDNTILTSSGSDNIFLAKYDLDGAIQWAVSCKGDGIDLANALSADGSGNIYLTGNFSGTMNFSAEQLTSQGKNDIFIAKYDSNGSVLWAKDFGSHTDDAAYGIDAGHSGNIVITGTFSDTIDFGGTELIAKGTSTGTSDIFIAKYTSSGNLLWAHQAGDTVSSQGLGAVIDNEENVYVTGFGDGTSPDCDGFGNILIAKYNSAGVLQWMKCAGNGGEEYGNAIALDSSGNIVVTGGFDYTINFGTGDLLNHGLIDAFIVKLNSSGVALWADRAGEDGTDFGNAVAIDNNGNLVFAGVFSDTCLFGPFELQSVRGTDVFIAKIGGQSSVQEISSSATHISLYPNPSQSAITIECSGAVKNSKVTVEFINLLGVTLKKNILSIPGESGLSISVKDFPKGIYFCRVLGKTWTQSQMLVIQ